MVIAVIGWGSLIWNPGSLPLGSGWFGDGPELPIEFARQSNDGRLTLVLTDTSKKSHSLWAKLSVKGKSEALEALRIREGCKTDRPIGYAFNGDISSHHCAENIYNWVKSKGLEGAVWTGLESKWDGSSGVTVSENQVVKYLSGLKGSQRDLAYEYISRTPEQVKTFFRPRLEELIHKSEGSKYE